MAGKIAKQLAGSGTGQSFMDRVTQAKYSLAGSALGKVVAKASTEELIAPKKKHLENLTKCSNEPNVSIPLLINFLSERAHEKSWVVVFKALITTHHLLNYGNEKVSQYMASNNCSFHLPHFNDKSSSQSYEMSLFIRKYSKYLAEKTKSYQLMAFDFCKVKRGKDDGVMRTMPANKLLKALPVLRDQLNVLFEFEATEKDLNNLIINAAFILLYKDLIRLFASYNEGMMNLVEKFFSMKRSHCRTALELYRDFPNIMTKVDEFLTVAERLGIGDKEAMGLHPVPPQILEAMEQHLALLNKTKKPGLVPKIFPNGVMRWAPMQKLDDDHDDADGKEEEDVGKNSTKKPLSTAKIAASPARPKSPSKHVSASPSRPTSSPAGEAKATPSEALLIADLNTLPVDEDNSSGNLPSNHIKAPPTEVIVTNPDGESTEPVEDDGVCQQVIEAEEEEEESEENEKDEADEAEGLSAEQQQAVIAAAAQHFAHSSELTNQAVKQSVMLTPRQTRKTQHETGGADRSPSSTRSRSPSPVRPPPPRSPSPVRPASPRSGRSTPLHETPDSDTATGFADFSGCVDESSCGRLHWDVRVGFSGAGRATRLKRACQGLKGAFALGSERASIDRPANRNRGRIHSPSHRTLPMSYLPKNRTWAKHVKLKASRVTKRCLILNPTADVDIDDLLGFGDEVPVSQVKPTVQAMSAPLQATQPPAVQSKPHSALDDLLSLDPLMDGGSNSTPLTGTATPSTKFDPSGLPAGNNCGICDLCACLVGLKPAPTDVLIRPAVVDKGAAKNANPLDQLDTTLASLASSLGSRTSDWGSASAKVSPNDLRSYFPPLKQPPQPPDFELWGWIRRVHTVI
ncbi:unnamed protein product [Mesocestoides corti]|uniref:ENTH domain-containing protein n=1 Tax=Mesocestoides corti TaxID=53468 RepID=A0A158QVD7_MESCO|nr:unnamed protein product [Mesocestoides corti]